MDGWGRKNKEVKDKSWKAMKSKLRKITMENCIHREKISLCDLSFEFFSELHFDRFCVNCEHYKKEGNKLGYCSLIYEKRKVECK